MKQIFPFFFLLLFIFSCKNIPNKNESESEIDHEIKKDVSVSKEELILKEKRTFSFEYDNSNIDSFGYFIGEEAIEINGPNDILLLNNQIYIMDRYHNTIKRFDYKTGNLISSIPISETFSYYGLYEFSSFNGNIYLSTESDTIYMFDKDLLLKEKLVIGEKGKFIESNKYKLKIWFPLNKNRLVEVNKNNQIISDNFNVVRKSGYYIKGKKCEINYSSLTVENKTIDISELVYRKGSFLDFNDSILVHYDIKNYYDNNPEPFYFNLYKIIYKP